MSTLTDTIDQIGARMMVRPVRRTTPYGLAVTTEVRRPAV
jgi:hypothetical protein